MNNLNNINSTDNINNKNSKDSFLYFHPIINMLYFVLVIGLTMFFTHPACLVISLACALSYSLYSRGGRALRFCAVFMLPMFILTVLINPLLSHQGVTILGYLPNGNPLTLESIIYGVFTGLLLVCVISWFSCSNTVMTSDRLVYLFGRIIPSLSLVLSMSLRFVPRFIAQVKVISDAQRCIGRDMSSGGILKRVRCGIKIVSILITWALENTIDTADSMKNRGYGLPGRTAFSIYRFTRRDTGVLIFLILCGGYMFIGTISNQLRFFYYPAISGNEPSLYLISLFVVWGSLCAVPLFINIKEDLMWKLQSKT